MEAGKTKALIFSLPPGNEPPKPPKPLSDGQRWGFVGFGGGGGEDSAGLRENGEL